MQTRILAHRGASRSAPENTMAAFRTALDAGAEGIELDLQMTGCGSLMVLHDESVDRTTDGSGYLAAMTAEQVRRLDAGSWFSDRYRGEKVPYLSEVLELISGQDVLLNIELKNGVIPYAGMEERLVEALSHYPAQQVLISSFNHYSLRHLKRLAPNVTCGALYMAGLVEPWFYSRRLGVEALHPLHLNIVPELVTGCRKRGVKLYPWTVDDPARMSEMFRMGVDGLITNEPALALTVRGQ